MTLFQCVSSLCVSYSHPSSDIFRPKSNILTLYFKHCQKCNRKVRAMKRYVLHVNKLLLLVISRTKLFFYFCFFSMKYYTSNNFLTPQVYPQSSEQYDCTGNIYLLSTNNTSTFDQNYRGTSINRSSYEIYFF